MSRLEQGEKEFVSGFGDLAPDAAASAAAEHGRTQEIDARGISSPLHVLRAHRALRAMQPGEQLRVLTTSEQTIAEFQSLVKHVVGYELLSQEQIGDEVVHLLRRKR
ncbi:sulfurtransferase TusA family protein [Ramlibacter sp. USB13]|uniref:Sulfurtransferase TusA family protein n=1 Tax=Ramlibacter cellulosilyticus TaxID=2764187 RepID=A0A923MV78_9BURK|nr:sulfurtransferase TusA family protein [Ramlibacter cellulosilyticus]MBC5785328.1 sulfurtransferase TusA family protein [Ramlibacter cellulosilyticus]